MKKILWASLMLALTATNSCEKRNRKKASKPLTQTEVSSEAESAEPKVNAPEVSNPQALNGDVPEFPATFGNDAPGGETNKGPETEGDIHLSKDADEATENKHNHPVSNGERLYNEAVAAIQAKNHVLATDLYLSSCQAGWINSCHRYGWQLSRQGNKRGAVPFFALACSRGMRKSCNNLGYSAEKDGLYVEARKFYGLACAYNHPRACESLGRVESMRTNESRPAH